MMPPHKITLEEIIGKSVDVIIASCSSNDSSKVLKMVGTVTGSGLMQVDFTVSDHGRIVKQTAMLCLAIEAYNKLP